VFVDDIRMHQVVGLASWALMGVFKAEGCVIKTLRDYISRPWEQITSFRPQFHLLSTGWVAFVFKDARYVSMILGKI